MPRIGKVDAPLQCDLPRMMNLKNRIKKYGISFEDSKYKYKSQELDINDQLKAAIKVGYIVTELLQKPMRSLDFIFGNKILHIQNHNGITTKAECDFLDKIGENIKSLVKNPSKVEEIKLAILDFLVKY